MFTRLSDTLFGIIGQPLAYAARYTFEAQEIKKSYRLDGLYRSSDPELPVYFVEVQFQRLASFYANLFAKVFSYLNANDPGQKWFAVALFANRSIEPTRREHYRPLLDSSYVYRVYLDEFPESDLPGLLLIRLLLVDAR